MKKYALKIRPGKSKTASEEIPVAGKDATAA